MIEYCNGMNLQKEIELKVRIPENEAILIMKQLINGIAVNQA
jgi:serine/threonine protein kinase